MGLDIYDDFENDFSNNDYNLDESTDESIEETNPLHILLKKNNTDLLLDDNTDLLLDDNTDLLLGNNTDHLLGNNTDLLLGNNTDLLLDDNTDLLLGNNTDHLLGNKNILNINNILDLESDLDKVSESESVSESVSESLSVSEDDFTEDIEHIIDTIYNYNENFKNNPYYKEYLLQNFDSILNNPNSIKEVYTEPTQLRISTMTAICCINLCVDLELLYNTFNSLDNNVEQFPYIKSCKLGNHKIKGDSIKKKKKKMFSKSGNPNYNFKRYKKNKYENF